MNLDWRYFAFGSAFFAALTAIFGKIAVSDINSNLATFIRTIVIALMTVLIISVRGEWRLESSPASRSIMFLILSGIATGLSWLCYYRALQMAPASRVAPIDKMSVVLVIIFAALFLSEPLTWKVIVGGAFIALGSIILAL